MDYSPKCDGNILFKRVYKREVSDAASSHNHELAGLQISTYTKLGLPKRRTQDVKVNRKEIIRDTNPKKGKS